MECLSRSRARTKSSRGGWFPRIDLNSRLGYQKVNDDFRGDEYQIREGSLELTQLIFDGSATSLNVEKFNHLKLARYYELLDTSEMIALEATRAYLDVMKYQHQLNLASSNYNEHYSIFKQVEERVNAGVGRGVDLEQATGRLALAESNRITEATNLHDVSSRYLRVIGEVPTEQLEKPEELRSDIPENIEDALRKAFTTHPAFTATMENMRAAQSDKKRTESAFAPKIEFVARHDTGRDRDTTPGSSDESLAEFRLNYNIFRGGSDLATVRQFNSRVDVARDQKNKVCRNIRQTLDIAYNDIKRLELQIHQLDQHQISISNARQAYRKQFDIGQRTLLDLLDSENEYFQAKRAYVASLYDYDLAFARTQAGMGNLLHSLNVRTEEFPQPDGMTRYTIDELDPDAICPPIGLPLRGLGETRVITAGLPEKPTMPGPAASMQSVNLPDVDQQMVNSPVTTPLEIKPLKATPLAAYPAGSPQSVETLEVHFAVGQSKIPKNDMAEIEKIGKMLQEFPAMTITLGGHTDSTGSDAFNFRLSRDRAEAVRNRFIYNYGIDPSRVLITWYSSKKPVADNTTADGRKLNRRTDAQVTITLNKADELKVIKEPEASNK